MERKWNLQDIRPSGERKRRRPVEQVEPARVEERPEPQRRVEPAAPARRRSSGRKGKKPVVLALIVAAVILIPGFAIGYLLDGAKLTVYPRVREANVNGTFTAYNEPREGELSYDIMTLEAEGERQVRATGQEEVEEQATGEIEIRNTRTTSERLIKNTRFESPEGLIFRITESVVVPAATTDSAGNVVPGTVRAQVFADEVGEEYNIGPSEFTVPGYREGGYDELYEAITGRSTTNMQGGFDGITYVVDDAELAAAQDSLHGELEEALRARMEGERPAGFVMFDEGITFSHESLPTTEAGNELVSIKERTLLHVPIFNEREFASRIADATLPGYEGEPVRIEDYSTLSFSYATTTDPDLRTLDSISFNLTGKPLVVWTYDAEELKARLAGTAKTALREVLSSYPAIERAEAAVRPFWKRAFPDDPQEITIVESLRATEEGE